jgi:predicted nucleotidyltransferase
MSPKISVPKDRIAEFCRRNRIRKLSFFGSVLRDDFSLQSDIDVLIEFEPGTRVGFIRFAGFAIELEEILGHRVDLNTPNGLSRYFRDEILSQAEVMYDAA